MAHRPVTRNAGGVPFLMLQGHFFARAGQQPDGDTIAFAAARRYSPGPVRTYVPAGTSGDQTCNIRLQSIDAPEKAQPLGAASRNALLEWLGFNVAALGLTDSDMTAGGPTQKASGWLATHGLDGNRRPLGYVFRENPGFRHGQVVPAAAVREVLAHSGNYMQADNGWAFPAFYENTDETHAAVFQQVAEGARTRGAGVWGVDATTAGFVPTRTALAAGGALVYPKFYRRVAKWKTARPDARAFLRWLKTQSDGKKMVQGAHAQPVRLWELFEIASKTRVRVPYDVTRLWFSE